MNEYTIEIVLIDIRFLNDAYKEAFDKAVEQEDESFDGSNSLEKYLEYCEVVIKLDRIHVYQGEYTAIFNIRKV